MRAHVTSLPFTLTKLLLTFLVLFCVSRLNLLPSSNSLDKVSPHEQFTGLKLDFARDLRCGFGDYVQYRSEYGQHNVAANYGVYYVVAHW